MRSCTADVTAFGVVVRIEQVSSHFPPASFQRSHIPANANNTPSLTSKQYGCLAFHSGDDYTAHRNSLNYVPVRGKGRLQKLCRLRSQKCDDDQGNTCLDVQSIAQRKL